MHNGLTSEGPLSGRDAEVLAELTERYLLTGGPVGSRTVAERRADHLSPATIRNVFVRLEREGYLEQPHTSAGRLPTPKAIRWWLQQLPMPPAADSIDSSALERELLHATDDAEAWSVASRFLSEVTHLLGVVAVHPWNDTGLKQIRFVRLTERRVLAILIAADDQVRERVSRVPESYTQAELDVAAQYFNRHYCGWTLRNIRRELVHRVNEERAAYDQLLRRVLVLYHCGLLELQDSGQVFMDGAGHLAAERSGAQMEALLERIQQKERWLRLLGRSSEGESEVVELQGEASVSEPAGIRVYVDLAQEHMPGYSLVSVDCKMSETGHGALAILGPTRMEYRRALCVLTRVRELLAQS